MKGLRLGVAVAAAAMGDLELSKPGAEAARGIGGAVVGAEHKLSGLDPAGDDASLDDRERLLLSAPEVDRPGRDLAGAAVDHGVQVAPAVLGDPDRGHVHVPELVGTLDAEVARPPASPERPVALQEALPVASRAGRACDSPAGPAPAS